MVPQVITEAPVSLPALEPGDRLDQPTFHARYEAMPEDTRAELIGGIVFMPSPMKVDHGRYHPRLNYWLTLYHAATEGTDVLDNATVILGDDSEPQPDSTLWVLPEYGGQGRVEAGYVVGAPELLGEVASSSEAYDLHLKRDDYDRYGVLEYLVVVLRDRRVVWFTREADRFVEIEPDDDGILRSRVFPGLWLDPQALFALDMPRLEEVLRQGLATKEHQQFVENLKQRLPQ